MSDTKKMMLIPPLSAKSLSANNVCRAVMMAGIMVIMAGCNDNTNVADQSAGAQCSGAKSIAASITPMAGGELAAFNVAESPEKMPLLAFKDRDGNKTDTAAFEGKTVLFNMWATWCAPCRKEMPAFDALQSEFGGEDFTIVPVSVDRGGPEKPLAFFEETGVQHLPFYQDETMGVFNSLKKKGLAFGLPVTVLLDKNGCILGSLNGPAEWAGKDAKALIKTAIEAGK